jgi:hypothetical protein
MKVGVVGAGMVGSSAAYAEKLVPGAVRSWGRKGSDLRCLLLALARSRIPRDRGHPATLADASRGGGPKAQR